ncbi:MAG TPA: hypothetical protein DCQ76_02835, partial [Ruminococcaceae bacterium]|nr:hypothetical protein [Oscillospiraceae bacterium]
VWLPKGRWTDIFTGKIYRGSKTVRIHSELNTMPVFAREGAVIPLSLDEGNSCLNPTVLKFKVYRGNGSFSLYEDDGETNNFKNGDFSITEVTVGETENGIKLYLCGGKEKDYLPLKRQYVFEFADIVSAESVRVASGEEKLDFSLADTGGRVTVSLPPTEIFAPIEVELCGITVLKNKPKREAVREVMTKFNGINNLKSLRYISFEKAKDDAALLSDARLCGNAALRSELLEVLEDLDYTV